MLNDKDRVYAIMAVQKAIDKIDDGFHNELIGSLVNVSNCLYDELPKSIQERLTDWYSKKEEPSE